MPSSYDRPGERTTRDLFEKEFPEKEAPLGPYKTYEEATGADFFKQAQRDRVWILMDPPENSRHTNPTKLKIVDFQPRRQALGIDKAKPNIINVSPSEEKEEIIPIGETEGDSRIPICWDSGRNFRRAFQETSEK